MSSDERGALPTPSSSLDHADAFLMADELTRVADALKGSTKPEIEDVDKMEDLAVVTGYCARDDPLGTSAAARESFTASFCRREV